MVDGGRWKVGGGWWLWLEWSARHRGLDWLHTPPPPYNVPDTHAPITNVGAVPRTSLLNLIAASSLSACVGLAAIFPNYSSY